MTTTKVKDLPFDIICQILYQLPVKSLFRFRCVSKLYRETIDDPKFIRTHHAQVSSSLLFGFGYKFSSIFQIEGNEIVQSHSYRQSQFLCSSNGFFLLLGDGNICLCNPSRRESIVVSSAPVDIKNTFLGFFTLKFGKTMEEYTIVYVLNEYRKDTEALIYSSKTKSWRKAARKPPSICHGRIRDRYSTDRGRWVVSEIVNEDSVDYRACYYASSKDLLEGKLGLNVISCKETLISPKHF